MKCDPGYACESSGKDSIDKSADKCDAGYYCKEAATNKQATICSLGNYCDEASAMEVPCPPGKACTAPATYREIPSGGVASTTFETCSAGHWCEQGSSTVTPSGSGGGELCPPGYFCEAGIEAPVPCPPGTYNPDSQG